VHGYDAFRVPLVGGYAFSSSPVPDSKGAVETPADEFGVVELQSSDAGCMSSKSADAFSGVNVPNLDGRVIRSGR